MTIQIQISKCSRTLKHDLTVKMMKTVNGHFVLISVDKWHILLILNGSFQFCLTMEY